MLRYTSKLFKPTYCFSKQLFNPTQIAKALNICQDTIVQAKENEFGNIIIKFKSNKITAKSLAAQFTINTEIDPEDLYFFKEKDELGVIIYDNEAKEFSLKLAELNIDEDKEHNPTLR